MYTLRLALHACSVPHARHKLLQSQVLLCLLYSFRAVYLLRMLYCTVHQSCASYVEQSRSALLRMKTERLDKHTYIIGNHKVWCVDDPCCTRAVVQVFSFAEPQPCQHVITDGS